MHRQKADEAYMIGKRGQYTPVAAYLAIDEIVKIAKEHNVNMIHPGYGFLSENEEFARKIEEAGMIFVGPKWQTIRDLGDKVSARNLAMKAEVRSLLGDSTHPADEVAGTNRARKSRSNREVRRRQELY